jgi:hypothetical protein
MSTDEGATGDSPGSPRWAKVFGLIVFIVVLLFVILMFTRGSDGHGPGRHTLSDAGGPPRPSDVAARHAAATRLSEQQDSDGLRYVR